jgi:hypothetical protein
LASSNANERRTIARIAAHTSWARTPDRTARTKSARSRFLDRFYEEVDPNGVLPPEERERRAESARRAYFTALALRSAQARRRKTGRGAERVD